MDDKLNRLRDVQKENLEKCLQCSSKWEKFREDYVHLQERLNTIADRIDYDIMVPFGSVGFAPGKLIHTNEILVFLGGNLFVERSSKQASEIVKRRIENCDAQLEKLKQERNQIENWASFTETLQNESGLINIVEEFNEEAEKEWRERRKMNKKAKEQNTTNEIPFEKYMERLNELELEEKLEGLSLFENKPIEANSSTNKAISNESRKLSQDNLPEETKAKIKWKDRVSSDSLTAPHYTGVPNNFTFNSPADIYTYYKITSEPRPLKSILKSSPRPESDSVANETISAKANTKHNEEVSSYKVRFQASELKKDTKVTSARRFETQAFSDVVVERNSMTEQIIFPDQPKRVSLFKANQQMKK